MAVVTAGHLIARPFTWTRLPGSRGSGELGYGASVCEKPVWLKNEPPKKSLILMRRDLRLISSVQARVHAVTIGTSQFVEVI